MPQSGFGEMAVPSRTNLPYKTNCVVEFVNWPSTGTTVTNTGSAGATYNATLTSNQYGVLPSGATYQAQSAAGDAISVANGAVVNNLGTFSMEFLFYVSSLSSAPRIFGHTFNFILGVASNGEVDLQRAATNNTNYIKFYSAAGAVSVGFNSLQLAWNSTLTGPDTCALPTLRVNNTPQTMYQYNNSPTTAWTDDTTYSPFTIGNICSGPWGGSNAMIGNTYVFRLHNALLTTAQFQQNYYADIWRI